MAVHLTRVIPAAMRGQSPFHPAINFRKIPRASLALDSPPCNGPARNADFGEFWDARGKRRDEFEDAACGVDARGGLVALPAAVQRSDVRGANHPSPAFRSQPRAALKTPQH